jgi:GNAT superfamily N-acetyltransferase
VVDGTGERRPTGWQVALELTPIESALVCRRQVFAAASSPRVAWVRVFTYADRPDLAARTGEVEDGFAKFMGHGEVAVRHWGKLREQLPELQLVLWDDERDAVVGHARTMPAREAEQLPTGVDDMLEAWFGDGARPEPDVLSALVAVVDRGRQGEGLSLLLIEAMRDLADRSGFQSLIAPVRPTWKDRYPLIPLERYVRWKREDGLPFDPWIRLHARLGAALLEVCPASMRIEGTREEWEEWVGMRFPDDGEYVVPGALVPVEFADGRGLYVEPNVWMRHPAQTAD